MAPPAIMQVFKAFIQSLGDMGDIIDMAVKANDGKSTYTVGELQNRATTGTICSITAASTKDLYLAGAAVSVNPISGGAALGTGPGGDFIQIHLMKNSTTMEVWSHTFTFLAGGCSDEPNAHSFTIKGAKVTTSEVFSLKIGSISTSYDVFGCIYGWQEDTGVSPQI